MNFRETIRKQQMNINSKEGLNGIWMHQGKTERLWTQSLVTTESFKTAHVREMRPLDNISKSSRNRLPSRGNKEPRMKSNTKVYLSEINQIKLN